ncbi:hypothetical protein JQX13_13345 [Archangium violaceum]|uniref:hypothetical protein n=1 Tax=Archangium violaceum TaxID=83451 RepID=UPI00193B9D9C|nr:hypothetical protein [Archangium violaceum]QRK10960.1 hypothetical protein JQX13_13345 [Archangium violaceum]
MSATYRIQDEPRPGALGHLVVNPVFPLLATMMGGVWLGLPWFVFNGFAMGSTTRIKELVLALLVVPGTLLLFFLLGTLVQQGVLTKTSAPYAGVGITVWKLAMGYVLFNLQQRSFALHEYYGGVVRNGALVLVASIFLGSSILSSLTGGDTLLLVLLG